MNDADLHALASKILAKVIAHITSVDHHPLHEVRQTDDGELVPTYGGESQEGYGAFLCEYMPLVATKSLIRECERLFDNFNIEVYDKQTGESQTRSGMPSPSPQEVRAYAVEIMTECALLHTLGSFRVRVADVLEEALHDSSLLAQCVLAELIAARLEGIEFRADAREEIENAAQRVAGKKRLLLRNAIKGLPNVLAERGRGRIPKSDSERQRECQEYRIKVEAAYRAVRLKVGRKPTKVSVADELGEGGRNPKGSDTRLNSFNLKLRRLDINYDEIVAKVEAELHNNS